MSLEPSIDSILDWQPPSPNYTPHSTKSTEIIFKSPSLEQQPDFLRHGSATAASPTIRSNLVPSGAISDAQMARSRPSSSTSLKRSRQENTFNHYYGSPPISQATFASGTAAAVSGPSLSHSFLEQFDNANIQDSFSTTNATAPTAAAPQMRTPPPTRDSSSRKRNSQSRLMPFTTPSSVALRRMSAPGDPLLQGAEGLPQDASPFQFTPFQFSPIDSTPLSNTGPLTAPVFHPTGLFWDPNSGDSDLSRPFSLTMEDPFASANPAVSSSSLFQLPQNSFQFDAGSRALNKRHSAKLHIERPQSARPADLTRLNTTLGLNASSTITSASSVNPSMLWTSPNQEPTGFSNSAHAPNKAAGEMRQPYQNQKEQLRREKELDRRRREARSRPHGRAGSDSLTPGKANAGLRRSLTDSRVRSANRNSQQTSHSSPIAPQESNPIVGRQLHIPRESSPLKRHKSGVHHDAGPAWSPPHTRKSVVLTVDAMGNARTEVKQLDRSGASSFHKDGDSWRDVAVDDSDSSDLPEKPSVSSLKTPMPLRSDAQNALREVVQDMRQRRDPGPAGVGDGHELPSSNPGSSLRAVQSVDTAPWDNDSPTTITDPDFMTPTSDHSAQFPSTTRCICNSNIKPDGNLMIQCDSCRQWLHVNCLDLNPQRLPRTFVCAFCTNETSSARANHLRSASDFYA